MMDSCDDILLLDGASSPDNARCGVGGGQAVAYTCRAPGKSTENEDTVAIIAYGPGAAVLVVADAVDDTLLQQGAHRCEVVIVESGSERRHHRHRVVPETVRQGERRVGPRQVVEAGREDRPQGGVEMPKPPEGAEWAPPAKVIDRLTYRFDGRGYEGQIAAYPEGAARLKASLRARIDDDADAWFDRVFAITS